MKAALYGKNAGLIRKLVRSANILIDQKNPDLIISYGGDGTILASERIFPSIPKLPIRDSKTCIKCPTHETKHVLNNLVMNNLKLEKIYKLSLKINKKRILALNDIVLRNSTPIHAARFRISMKNNQFKNRTFVGDGLVFSTAFGSTGYFKSITGKLFTQGFGVAFNNLTDKMSPIFFSSKEKFVVEIVRGPALLSVDNNPKIIDLKEGGTFEVEPSIETALVYQPQSLRCNQCKMLKERRLS